MTHSPTPFSQECDGAFIADLNGKRVCAMGKQHDYIRQATAALIVHRVNTYEAIRGHVLNAAICLDAGGSKAEALRILNSALELSKEISE